MINKEHGEWLYRENENDRYETYVCSCCGKEITVDASRFCDIGFTIEDFEHCLACGAKMD